MKLTSRQPNPQPKVKHRLYPLSNTQRVRLFIRDPQRLLDEVAAMLGILFILTLITSTILIFGGAL